MPSNQIAIQNTHIEQNVHIMLIMLQFNLQYIGRRIIIWKECFMVASDQRDNFIDEIADKANTYNR